MTVTTNDPANGSGGFGPPGPSGPVGPAGPTFTQKTGIIPGGSFAGNPKIFAVVFATPYANANYGIEVSGVDARAFNYESKTAAGFTINTNANTAIANEVSWVTIPVGET